MLPKVSIILPVYNSEQTIERCINSIVNQTYKNIELLLVDDGSTDSTGALCDKWAGKDSRIRVVHKENSGVSDARNLALKEAVGEYLQFADSDDWLSPEATGYFVEAAQRYQCDLVISDFYRVAGERKAHKGNIEGKGPFSLETYAAYMMEKPADFYYGVLWNKLYRREIVECFELRMNPSVSWCEDFMFNLEYLRKLLDGYLEPVAIRYELSLKEVRLLYYLAEAMEASEPCSKQELADLLSESVQDISHQLRRLEGKEYLLVNAAAKKDGRDRGRWKLLQITFLPGAESVLEEMKSVQADCMDAKFAFLSPKEREVYLELTQKIETGIREKLYTRRLSK